MAGGVRAALACLLLIPFATAAAQEPPAAAPLDPNAAYAALRAGDAGKAAAIAAALLATTLDPASETEARIVLATARLLQGRQNDAFAAYRDAERAARAAGARDATVIDREVRLAGGYGGIDRALVALRRAMATQPVAIAGMDPRVVGEVLGGLLQQHRTAEVDALALQVVALGVGRDDPSARSELLMLATEAQLRAGRPADALVVAAEITDRDQLTTLLTERRFDPLWPGLEARVGDGMAASDAAAIAQAERRASAAPADGRLKRALIHAYLVAGRLDAAAGAGADFATTPDALAAIDQEGGWAINEQALALSALGRWQEADRRLAAVDTLDPARNPWAVGLAINRVQLLADGGHWAEAAALLPATAERVARFGSPFAAQLLRTLRLRIARGLEPRADTGPLLAELREHREEAPGPLVDALVVIGRLDEAEAVLIAMLGNPDQRAGAIAALQPPAYTRADPTSLCAAALARRPAVLAALAPVGRALPERFRAVATRR